MVGWRRILRAMIAVTGMGLSAAAFGYHFHQPVIVVFWAAVIWPALIALIVIGIIRERRKAGRRVHDPEPGARE